MKFYEVFLNLMKHNKKIGATCVQVQSKSPFTAATEAEYMLTNRYGNEVWSHAVKVSPITRKEFLYQMVA